MTTTTLAMLAAVPRADREALQKAHDAAAEFHAALSRVVMAEIELDDPAELEWIDATYWEREKREALGAAAVAMERVPREWLATLCISSIPPDENIAKVDIHTATDQATPRY